MTPADASNGSPSAAPVRAPAGDRAENEPGAAGDGRLAPAAPSAATGLPLERRRVRHGGRAVPVTAIVLSALPWAWFWVRSLHPALDLVAIMLPLVVAAALVGTVAVVLVVRRAVLVAPVVSMLVFGFVAICLPWSPRATGPPRTPVTILSANVAGFEELAPAEAVVGSLLRAGGDVVVVDELSPLIDRLLRPSFPYHAETFPDGEEDPEPPAVGVFARWPIVELAPAPGGLPGLRLVLAGPTGQFVVYAMHVPKAALGGGGGDWSTSFTAHDGLLAGLARSAASESLPVVVAGDLNTPDRTRGYRRLSARLRDAARTSWTGPTSVKSSVVWRLLALRVDHVFVSRAWCADDASRPVLSGSDHRAVRVAVGPCRDG